MVQNSKYVCSENILLIMQIHITVVAGTFPYAKNAKTVVAKTPVLTHS
jgi:hypothetical protein